MRGQVSVEYVMIVGISLVILIPAIIAGISTTQLYQQKVTERQLERTAFDITNIADQLAFEGPPAKRTLRTYFPNGLEQVQTDNNTIVFTYRAGEGTRQVVLSTTYANLSWNATNIGQGYRNLVLTAEPTRVVIR